jgi:hypothetical protein
MMRAERGRNRFTDAEMHDALDRLLNDAGRHERLTDAAATIKRRDGVHRAADLIEQTGRITAD